jgi:two-component system, OmpR family, sensor histidine kinase KdpD
MNGGRRWGATRAGLRGGYVGAALVMAACTAAGTLLLPVLSITDIAMLYLLAVGLVASWTARGPSVFAALLSVALFDFFFVPPRFAFTVSDLHYIVTFGVMLASALVISWLTERVRTEALAARERERGTAALYPMSGELLDAKGLAEVTAVIARHLRAAFAADVQVLLRETGGRLAPPAGTAPGFALAEPERELAQRAFQLWQPAGRGTSQYPEARVLYLPLVGTATRIGVLAVRPDEPGRFDDAAVQWLLQTFAGQAALALERAMRGERP